jgi:hypothetical protein
MVSEESDIERINAVGLHASEHGVVDEFETVAVTREDDVATCIDIV